MNFQEKCSNCGGPKNEGATFCGNCGKPFEEPKNQEENQSFEPASEQPSMTPSPQPQSQEERKYVAWEDRENKGFFDALWETWKESVFSPDEFYSKLPYRGGIGGPLLYAIIVGWVGIAISQIIGMMFSAAWMGMLSPYIDNAEIFMGGGMQMFGAFTNIILAPVLIVIVLFFLAGIYHLLLLIFGWAERDFEATFRALAYAEGPIIFSIIPLCGGLVGGIWSIVMGIFGIKHMQKTTGGKAALVYFLPMALCCCLVLILVFIFGTALLSLFQEMMNTGEIYY